MRLAHLFGGHKGFSEFFDLFARRHLDAVLAEAGFPAAARIEQFATGQNALIRRLVLSDGRSLVLRGYFVDPEKQSGANHWHLNRRLAELGVRVATVHFHRTFPFPRGKADVEILLEDCLEGDVVSDAMRDDETLRRHVADLLLRIHRDQAARPGRPWLGLTFRDPLHEALEKAPARLKRVQRILDEATPARIESCRKWLLEQIAKRPIPAAYELVHHDWNRENLLVMPDGHLALVDLVPMAYGCFESDLAGARWMMFDEAWWRAFCEDYFAGAPDRRERFERNVRLFFADFFLIKASRQASSAGKAREDGDSDGAEAHRAKSRRFWNLLLAVVEGGTMA